VLGRDGKQIGTVHHVVAAPQQDIFHGLVISTPHSGRRFVAAEEVASLHERGVDLKIDCQAVGGLPTPGGGAPVYVEDPGASAWSHWTRKLTGRGDWHRVR
jgi:hypothetical protein